MSSPSASAPETADERCGVRYPGDDDPIVALLTEVLVAELLAAHWWLG